MTSTNRSTSRGGLYRRMLGLLSGLATEGTSAGFAVVCLLLFLSPGIARESWFLIGFFAFGGVAAIKAAAVSIIAAAKAPPPDPADKHGDQGVRETVSGVGHEESPEGNRHRRNDTDTPV